MKWNILHESRGRIRLHLRKPRMSLAEADQLQDYLSTLRVRFGFLTNGRIWRMYDTDKITAKKTYLQFDLQAICALPEGSEKTEALALFAFYFGRDTYATYAAPTAAASQTSAIEQTLAASADFTLAVEENLKAVIYGYAGEDSPLSSAALNCGPSSPHPGSYP